MQNRVNFKFQEICDMIFIPVGCAGNWTFAVRHTLRINKSGAGFIVWEGLVEELGALQVAGVGKSTAHPKDSIVTLQDRLWDQCWGLQCGSCFGSASSWNVGLCVGKYGIVTDSIARTNRKTASIVDRPNIRHQHVVRHLNFSWNTALAKSIQTSRLRKRRGGIGGNGRDGMGLPWDGIALGLHNIGFVQGIATWVSGESESSRESVALGGRYGGGEEVGLG